MSPSGTTHPSDCEYNISDPLAGCCVACSSHPVRLLVGGTRGVLPVVSAGQWVPLLKLGPIQLKLEGPGGTGPGPFDRAFASIMAQGLYSESELSAIWPAAASGTHHQLLR